MQQEIDAVIGPGRCPYVEDRKSLPFTDAVLHEIQRYLDIVPFSIPRYALHDISFRGYTIPKVFRPHRETFPDSRLIRNCPTWPGVLTQQDTIIIPLLHSVLKDDKVWETPESFNPQHFLDEKGNFKKNPAFLPFSAGESVPAHKLALLWGLGLLESQSLTHSALLLSGKRACVGESLARMEIFLFMVTLLQHLTLTCPGGPDSVDLTPEYSSFANVPRKYKIIATPRWWYNSRVCEDVSSVAPDMLTILLVSTIKHFVFERITNDLFSCKINVKQISNNFNYADLFHRMFLFCVVLVVRWWQSPVLPDFCNLMSLGSGDPSGCQNVVSFEHLSCRRVGLCQAPEITVRSDAAARRRRLIQSKKNFSGGKVKPVEEHLILL